MTPREYIKKALDAQIKSLTKETIEYDLEPKDFSQFGDFSANVAFVLAKTLKKAPPQIAEEVKSLFEKSKDKYISRVDIAGGGFLNFFLNKNIYADYFDEITDKKTTGINIGEGKKVIVEYSSPNIAKPMHAGNLRATLVGDFLARLYKSLGYKVIKWNHLGDWGTQFGMIISAYKKWGDKKEIDRNPIDTLLALYIRFNLEAKENPDFYKEAQEEFAKLENGDRTNKKLFKWFVDLSMKEFNRTYKVLGVNFDVVKGESYYEKDLSPLIADLKKSKVAVESEGALVVMLDKQGLPPALLEKSDGATLYMTRDVASLMHRIKAYKPAKILYVVGSQQSLHFKQFIAVADILGLTNKTEIEHVSFGWILGPDGKKLATREGKIITAQSLLDEIISSSKQVVEKKRGDISQKEQEKISQIVGIGALKYNLLKDYRDSDIIYSPEKALSLKGNSGPYLNYTFARFSNILKKAKKIKTIKIKAWDEQDVAIIKQISLYQDVILDCAKYNSANNLTDYLFGLANSANGFYEKNNILNEKDERVRNSRLLLVKSICQTLKNGMEILGITPIDKI